MAVADSFGGQHVLIDQPHDGRAAYAEKVGRLLCGECHGLRRDGHCFARTKCCYDLRQGFVDCPGQFDAVVLVDADESVRSYWWLA
jgi:hypothetical protein